MQYLQALPDKVSYPSDEDYMGVWVDGKYATPVTMVTGPSPFISLQFDLPTPDFNPSPPVPV